MIHAKIDVKLHSHPKARKAGIAMSTWTWALCFIRDHETDGFVSDAMIGAAWSGEVQARKDAAKLVAVGLWEVVAEGEGPDGDGGWRMSKYADKNETRAEIDVRRSEDRGRKRMGSFRNPDGIRSEPKRARAESVVGIPGSGSGSVALISESRSEDPPVTAREIPKPPPSQPHNDAPPAAVPTSLVDLGEVAPPWWAAACETVATNVAPVSDRGARWLEYTAARSRKGWAKNQQDAVGWLSTVVRSELRSAPTSKRKPIDGKQPLLATTDPGWLEKLKTGSGDF